MFTGIIESIGKVLEVESTDGGKIFWIETEFFENDLKIGDSISVNGACQTVTELRNNRNEFKIYSSYKTLELTNLSELTKDSFVNLERAMLMSTRLSGHLVSGHVDGKGHIVKSDIADGGKVFRFHLELDKQLLRYSIERGSITIDGISLTIVSIVGNQIELVLIPETIEKTNARYWKNGTVLNIETDLIAKYIEKLTTER
ncbi:MAG: riboflavin synthase [Leptospiraceae bacterium]|nr:riboflavin synthase [Leptospiraceae bacterium]MCP5511717.1 riboflavin synthase [Leptospiraceae bacterium]